MCASSAAWFVWLGSALRSRGDCLFGQFAHGRHAHPTRTQRTQLTHRPPLTIRPFPSSPLHTPAPLRTSPGVRALRRRKIVNNVVTKIATPYSTGHILCPYGCGRSFKHATQKAIHIRKVRLEPRILLNAQCNFCREYACPSVSVYPPTNPRHQTVNSTHNIFNSKTF